MLKGIILIVCAGAIVAGGCCGKRTECVMPEKCKEVTPLRAIASDMHPLLLEARNRMKTANLSTPNAQMLFDAVMLGDMATVKKLEANHIDLKVRSDNDYTAMHAAAFGGDVNMMKYLKSRNLEIDAVTDGGYAVIHSAAEGGNCCAIEFLLAEGADLEVADNSDLTALAYAASNDNFIMVKCLLLHGAKVTSEVMEAAVTPAMKKMLAANGKIGAGKTK